MKHVSALSFCDNGISVKRGTISAGIYGSHFQSYLLLGAALAAIFILV
jgi:hypothetical protein